MGRGWNCRESTASNECCSNSEAVWRGRPERTRAGRPRDARAGCPGHAAQVTGREARLCGPPVTGHERQAGESHTRGRAFARASQPGHLVRDSQGRARSHPYCETPHGPPLSRGQALPAMARRLRTGAPQVLRFPFHAARPAPGPRGGEAWNTRGHGGVARVYAGRRRPPRSTRIFLDYVGGQGIIGPCGGLKRGAARAPRPAAGVRPGASLRTWV